MARILELAARQLEARQPQETVRRRPLILERLVQRAQRVDDFLVLFARTARIATI